MEGADSARSGSEPSLQQCGLRRVSLSLLSFLSVCEDKTIQPSSQGELSTAGGGRGEKPYSESTICYQEQ